MPRSVEDRIRRFAAGSRARALGLGLCLAAAGCAGAPSVVDPAGAPADRLSVLTWVVTAAAAAVFLVVVGMLLWPLLRTRRRGSDRGGFDPRVRLCRRCGAPVSPGDDRCDACSVARPGSPLGITTRGWLAVLAVGIASAVLALLVAA